MNKIHSLVFDTFKKGINGEADPYPLLTKEEENEFLKIIKE